MTISNNTSQARFIHSIILLHHLRFLGRVTVDFPIRPSTCRNSTETLLRHHIASHRISGAHSLQIGILKVIHASTIVTSGSGVEVSSRRICTSLGHGQFPRLGCFPWRSRAPHRISISLPFQARTHVASGEASMMMLLWRILADSNAKQPQSDSTNRRHSVNVPASCLLLYRHTQRRIDLLSNHDLAATTLGETAISRTWDCYWQDPCSSARRFAE